MSFPQTSVAQSAAGAFAGLLVDSSPSEVRSYVSEESSAEIPFGVMVCQGTADNGAKLLNTSAAAMAKAMVGIVLHSHGYAKDNELGDDGLKPKVIMRVLHKGVAWVQVEEAVTPASAVKVRAVATGEEVPGAFRDTPDGTTDCVDISAFARYLTSAGAGGFAQIAIDMTDARSGVADT